MVLGVSGQSYLYQRCLHAPDRRRDRRGRTRRALHAGGFSVTKAVEVKYSSA